MKTNLALIGFMGVGKSATAELLAKRLGKTLVEVDREIERKAGKSIPRVFEEEGEIGFRAREIEAIKQIGAGRNQVVACGGGAVLNQINTDRLKLSCVIIWLTASLNAIMKRTKLDGESRPVLKSAQSQEALQRLISYRRPLYQRAAEIKINTTRLSVEAVVERILVELKSYADYDS